MSIIEVKASRNRAIKAQELYHRAEELRRASEDLQRRAHDVCCKAQELCCQSLDERRELTEQRGSSEVPAAQHASPSMTSPVRDVSRRACEDEPSPVSRSLASGHLPLA